MRRSTRLPWQVAVTVVSLDPEVSYRETGKTLVVNMHGCGIEIERAVPAGTRIRVEVGEKRMTGHVVDVGSIDDKVSLLGVALDQAANIWGVQEPPPDWDLTLQPLSQTVNTQATADAPGASPATPTPSVPPTPRNAAILNGAGDTMRREVIAQLERLEQAHAQHQTMLKEEQANSRAAREAAEKAIAEQLERVRQARAYVESLACSLPAAIKAQALEQSKAFLQQIRESSTHDVSLRVRAAVDELEARLRETIAQTRRDVLDEVARQAGAGAAKSAAAAGADIPAFQTALRQSARQLGAELARQSESAAAQLRDALSRLIAEQQQRLNQRDEAAKAALQTVGGQMLASMRQEVHAELKRQLEAIPPGWAAENGRLIPDGPTLEGMLREHAAKVVDEARQQFETSLEQRQQKFEAAHAAATLQLQQLETRTESLTAKVDLELDKHADELVGVMTNKVREDLDRHAAEIRATQVEQTRAELQSDMAATLQRADEARAELRQMLDSLQNQLRAQEGASAEIGRRLAEAQAWVSGEMQKFEQTLHDAFVEASGQIRGRIRQAVEMAAEPLEARSRELQEELAKVGRQYAEHLNRAAGQAESQVENGRQRLQASCDAAQSVAEAALRIKMETTVASCKRELQDLTRGSVERWQTAMSESLAAMRRVLGEQVGKDAKQP